MPHLILAALLASALSTFHDVADNAYLPTVVNREELVPANSALSASSSVAEVSAFSIGGVLVRGEKGTAKSTMVRAQAALLPLVDEVEGCRFACDPRSPDPACPDGPHPADAPVRRRPAREADPARLARPLAHPDEAAQLATKYATDGQDPGRSVEIIKLRNASTVNAGTPASRNSSAASCSVIPRLR